MRPPPPGRLPDHDADDDAMLDALGLTAPGRGGRDCPSLAAIQAEQAGVLPDDTGRAVADHVAGCASCRALAAAAGEWDGPELDADSAQRIARRAGLGSASRRRPTARAAWLLPLAAAAALAVAVPFLLRSRPHVSETTDPRPSAAPTAVPFLLPLEKLERRGAPGITVRGAGDFDGALAAALAPYDAGDLDEAVARLTRLAAAHPDAASPRLYLGVAELLRGRPHDAQRALESARPLARELWRPHVLWYLAIAHERTGDRAAAVRLLAELCAASGEYHDRACAAAARVDAR